MFKFTLHKEKEEEKKVEKQENIFLKRLVAFFWPTPNQTYYIFLFQKKTDA